MWYFYMYENINQIKYMYICVHTKSLNYTCMRKPTTSTSLQHPRSNQLIEQRNGIFKITDEIYFGSLYGPITIRKDSGSSGFMAQALDEKSSM